MASIAKIDSECGSQDTFGSRRSLPCFSVDESVLHILWDEDVSMEQLLNFSYDHIDRLAAKRKTTVEPAEKDRLWDYIQTMKKEQPDWTTTAELEAVYALRARSVSDFGRDLGVAAALTWADPPETPEAGALSALSSSPGDEPSGQSPMALSRVRSATLGSYPVTPGPARKKKLWRRLFHVGSHKNVPPTKRAFIHNVTPASGPLRLRNLAPLPQEEEKEPSQLGLQGFLRRSLSRLMISSKTAKPACPASQ